MMVFNKYLTKLKQNPEATHSQSKVLAEAIRYIQCNYPFDISLQQVAEQVELSPNYLSSLFKKELQLGFVEYFNRVRIENAKELLLNTHFKTYKVADKVGVPDEGYFGRIFKRFTGMTPNEFRRQRFVNVQGEADIHENPKGED